MQFMVKKQFHNSLVRIWFGRHLMELSWDSGFVGICPLELDLWSRMMYPIFCEILFPSQKAWV